MITDNACLTMGINVITKSLRKHIVLMLAKKKTSCIRIDRALWTRFIFNKFVNRLGSFVLQDIWLKLVNGIYFFLLTLTINFTIKVFYHNNTIMYTLNLLKTKLLTGLGFSFDKSKILFLVHTHEGIVQVCLCFRHQLVRIEHFSLSTDQLSIIFLVKKNTYGFQAAV